MATKKTTTAGKPPLQQHLELGPEPVDANFKLSYQTQIYSNVESSDLAITKGFCNADLLPWFIQDRRKLSLVGAVTANDATYTRHIQIDGKSATLIQKAANISSKIGPHRGKQIFRHLGEREETVLDALKYIASRCPGSFGTFQDSASLRFTIAQIRNVIKGSYNHIEIAEALDVLHSSDIELRMQLDEGSTVVKPIKSAILPILITNEDSSFDNGINDHAKKMCTFHPLITKELVNMNFRQLDYVRIRDRSSGLAKYIERRLSHNYTQASVERLYGPIFGSSILLGAGLEYDRTRDSDTNFKPIKRALKELTIPDGISASDLTEEEQRLYILSHVDVEPIYDQTLLKRKRIVDFKYTMHPTQNFIDQQIEANIAQRRDLERFNKARELGVQPKDIPNIKLDFLVQPDATSAQPVVTH